MSLYDNPISFSDFCRLLTSIRTVKPLRKGQTWRGKCPKELQNLQAWVSTTRGLFEGHAGLPLGTITIFFRLFFPEEGVRRRYDMKEQALSKRLCRYLRLKDTALDGWCRTTLDQRTCSSGCLGRETEMVMLLGQVKRPLRQPGSLTLGRVDELLDELAAFSKWSHESGKATRSRLHQTKRTVDDVLKDLFDPVDTEEMAFMIQIILRDLSPLLYSPPSSSGVVALREYNTLAYHQVPLYEAMAAWHPRMPSFYEVVADLDFVSGEVERPNWNSHGPWSPVLGKYILRPPSVRPGTCSQTTRGLVGEVAVETKYDGERLQIHIDMDLTWERQIKIFSKSGRDSTHTRSKLLPTIRRGLGLEWNRINADLRSVPRRMIIEGEMVPYDEDAGGIAEFWTLASVKSGGLPTEYETESQESTSTGGTASPESIRAGQHSAPRRLHLMIVWFDLLLLDNQHYLNRSYLERRKTLEHVVTPLDGHSMLADSKIISFNDRSDALQALRKRFATVIAQRGEGLMLKHLDSKYNDTRPGRKWIKLKKDFIPGLGDTMDVCVLGASWQRDRGRKLGVPPSVFTTFFVGFLANDMGPNPGRENKPHYHILFAASYGLDREQLHVLCERIRESKPLYFENDRADNCGGCLDTTFSRQSPRWPTSHFPVWQSPCTTFTFSLADHLVTKYEKPSWIFKVPLTFELTGAGFQRHPDSQYYELRWPRVTKFDIQEGDPVDLMRLQQIVNSATRIRARSESVTRFADSLWSHEVPVQDVVDPEASFDEEVAEWCRKLGEADAGLTVSPVVERKSPRNGLHRTNTSRRFTSVTNVGACNMFTTKTSTTIDHRYIDLPTLTCAQNSKWTATAVDTSFSPPSIRPDGQQPSKEIEVITILDSDSEEDDPRTSSSPTPSPYRRCGRSDIRPQSLSPSRSHPKLATQRTEQALLSGLATPRKRPLRSSSPPSSLTTQPTSRKRPYEISLGLPPLSLSTALYSSPSFPRPPLPSEFWSYYPPLCPTKFLHEPSPTLDSNNFLINPFDVFYAAGFSVSSCGLGEHYDVKKRRNGIVFIGDSVDTKGLRGLLGVKKGNATVWLVGMNAVEKEHLERFVYDIW